MIICCGNYDGLVGDFNAKPFDMPYFIVTNYFKDAWEEAGHPTLSNPNGYTFQTTALEARIDYVFLAQKSGLRARDVKVTESGNTIPNIPH
jgi:endonuclease/exonuclease/phosphatase family metal-dependent hydrolase